MTMRVHSVIDRNVIFDGEPNFMPDGMIISTLNHHSLGASAYDFTFANNDMSLGRPTRFKVQLVIEYSKGEGEWTTHSVNEQDAIYDSRPKFMPDSLIMNLLTWNSLEPSDLAHAKNDPNMRQPTHYKVRVTIKYEAYPAH
jgi:hypothetical protein